MPDADKSAEVSRAIGGIKQRFADWEPAEGKANQHLWALLGRIYEASIAIDGDKVAKAALVVEVRQIDGLRSSNRWDPTKKTAAELLLSILLGLSAETKGTKSQWLSAVRAARDQDVEPTEAAYVKWIKGIGGVVAAGKVLKGKGSRGDQSNNKFSLANFTKSISERSASFDTLKLPINPGTELYEGLSLVLVHRGMDENGRWNDKLNIVAKVSEASLVEKVAKAVEQGRISNSAPSDLDLIEAKLLFQLNLFTLKQAKIIKTKPSFVEWKAFRSAVKKLQSTPMLAHKFLDGAALLKGTVDPVAKLFSFDILNADYKQFDPGRFIANAKPLALVPYFEGKDDDIKILNKFYDYRNDLRELISRVRIANSGLALKDSYYVDI